MRRIGQPHTGPMMLTTHPFDDDKLREECGIFGIYGAQSASAMVALGLHALQHRGQEAAGSPALTAGSSIRIARWAMSLAISIATM